MSLTSILAHFASIGDMDMVSPANLPDYLRSAVRGNEVDALSILLSLVPLDDERCRQVEELSFELLRLAIRSGDAAECALCLLLYLEESRRHREMQAPPQSAIGTWRRMLEAGQQLEFEKRMRLMCQERNDIIERRESFCGAAPRAPDLLALAREALTPAPAEEAAGGRASAAAAAACEVPAPRCGRALLLQAHRLRKQKPRANRPLLDALFEKALLDCNGQPSLPWPPTPADLPSGFLPKGGIGGYDLSMGAEAVPLQWINETDFSTPPPIVFVNRCMDVDVRPDWVKKAARSCAGVAKGTSRSAVAGGDSLTDSAKDRCWETSFHGGCWQGAHIECNWACAVNGTCDAQCSRRSMQRGGGHRLQVFKDPNKGWCLRTLSRIRSGDFIMEYVAERISPSRLEERLKDAPDIDVYVMDMEGSAKKHLKLDALVVRNHAAFAAFACSTKFRNMKKTRYATSHWDPRLPQIGFYATRDIEPGEELTYLRTDGEPDLRRSHTTCGCRLPGCSTRT